MTDDTNDEAAERTIERMGFSRKIIDLGVKAESAGLWSPEEIASALLVAHVGYARRFMAIQDVAAALRQVADNLEASPPRLEPELLN